MGQNDLNDIRIRVNKQAINLHPDNIRPAIEDLEKKTTFVE